MPIFTPTQGQGAFLPVKSPQVPAPSVDPLDVLGAASVFQRNRQLNQQDEQLRLSARAIDLREQLGAMENQRELFRMINEAYSVGAAKNSNSKQEHEFGMHPDFYPEQINTYQNNYNNALNEALGITQGAKGKNSTNQVAADLKLSVETNFNKMKNDSSIREAQINTGKYDATIDAVDNLVNTKGMAVIEPRREALFNKMRKNGEGEGKMFAPDFDANKFVFDPKEYEKKMKETVTTLLDKHNITTTIKKGESIDSQTVEEVQRSIDEVQNRAYDFLSRDHDVMGAMENLSFFETNDTNKVSPQAELMRAIDSQLSIARNDVDRLLTSETEQADTASEDLYKEPEMNETRSEIKRLGGDPDNPRDNLGPAAAIRAIMKMRAEEDKVTISIDPENGDVVYDAGGKIRVRFPINAEEQKNRVQSAQRVIDQFIKDNPLKEPLPTDETSAPTTAPPVAPSLVPITEDSLKQNGVNISLKGGKDHKLSNRAIDVLKSLPTDYNTSDLVLTDSFRTEEENANVGGVKNSAHKTGDGLDIRTHNEKGTDFAKWVTQTDKGKKWLNENNYAALWENKGKSNEHLHLGPKGALDYVEDQESRDGKAARVAIDGDQMAVSQLQFRGPKGNEFLKKIGITGYNLNSVLSTEDMNKLTAELTSMGEDVVKQKAQEHYNESILPDFQARLNIKWPELGDISKLSEGVKIPFVSLSIQTGQRGQNNIFDDVLANLGENPTEKEIINLVQDARKRYVDASTSITEKNKKLLTKRYEEEREIALDLLGNSQQQTSVKVIGDAEAFGQEAIDRANKVTPKDLRDTEAELSKILPKVKEGEFVDFPLYKVGDENKVLITKDGDTYDLYVIPKKIKNFDKKGGRDFAIVGTFYDKKQLRDLVLTGQNGLRLEEVSNTSTAIPTDTITDLRGFFNRNK